MLAIIHVHYVQSFITSTNATLDQIIPSVIMSVQLGWGLISATILCLKSFVATLGSGYLGATLNTNLGPYVKSSGRSGGRSVLRDESYVLNEISVTRAQKTTVTGGQDRVSHGPQDAASISSANRVSDDGSQEFIIWRTVEYKVNFEDSEDHRKDKRAMV